MANRWGFRPITIAGSFIASIAFALSSQATSLPYLYVTFGLIGGIGFSMIYIPGMFQCEKNAFHCESSFLGKNWNFSFGKFNAHLVEIATNAMETKQKPLILNCSI